MADQVTSGAKFDEEAGVGIEITVAQIKDIVKSIIDAHKDDVTAARFRSNVVLLSLMSMSVMMITTTMMMMTR